MDGGLVFPSIDIQPSKGFTWPCQLEAHQGKPHRSYHLRWVTLDRGVLGTPVASRYGTVCWAWNPLKKRKSTRSWLVSTPPTWQKGNGTRKTSKHPQSLIGHLTNHLNQAHLDKSFSEATFELWNCWQQPTSSRKKPTEIPWFHQNPAQLIHEFRCNVDVTPNRRSQQTCQLEIADKRW